MDHIQFTNMQQKYLMKTLQRFALLVSLQVRLMLSSPLICSLLHVFQPIIMFLQAYIKVNLYIYIKTVICLTLHSEYE